MTLRLPNRTVLKKRLLWTRLQYRSSNTKFVAKNSEKGSVSRPLSQLLNALLKSQGGWDVHSCKCSSYLDKCLSCLGVL